MCHLGHYSLSLLWHANPHQERRYFFFKFIIKLFSRSQQQLQQLQLAVLQPFRLHWLSWRQYSDATFCKENFTVRAGETALSKKCPCVHRNYSGSSTVVEKWCMGSKWNLWNSFYFVWQAFCVVLIQVRKNITPCGLNVHRCVCVYAQMCRHTYIWIHTGTHIYIHSDSWTTNTALYSLYHK